MEAKQIVLKGLAVRYYLSVPAVSGGSATALFLHGWRSEGKVWAPTMAWLAEQGIPSMSLDLPGFGASEVPRTAWGVGEYADAVDEFVQKMELKAISLIGHSFGGRVAIKLAAREPTYIEKLVLVDSHGFRDDSHMRRMKGAIAKIVKPIFHARPLQPLRDQIYRSMGAEDYVATPALREIFVKVVNEDLQANMRQIHCSTRLVWGSEDRATPVALGERIAASVPGARMTVIPGAGHFSFLDKPKEFRDILLECLKG